MKYLKTILYTIEVNILLFFLHIWVIVIAIFNDTGYTVDNLIYFFVSVFPMAMLPLIIGYYIAYIEMTKKREIVTWLYILINFLIICMGTTLLMSSYYAPFPIKL